MIITIWQYVYIYLSFGVCIRLKIQWLNRVRVLLLFFFCCVFILLDSTDFTELSLSVSFTHISNLSSAQKDSMNHFDCDSKLFTNYNGDPMKVCYVDQIIWIAESFINEKRPFKFIWISAETMIIIITNDTIMLLTISMCKRLMKPVNFGQP